MIFDEERSLAMNLVQQGSIEEELIDEKLSGENKEFTVRTILKKVSGSFRLHELETIVTWKEGGVIKSLSRKTYVMQVGS